jgi:riboflavin synthase
MFTGIIQGLGTVTDIRPSKQGMRLSVRSDFPLDDPKEGESIAVNGVCLTATTITERSFTADISPETVSRSTLRDAKAGLRVNLERALRLSDRLGGHLVSGHVDGVGRVVEKKALDQFTLFSCTIPKTLERYIIEKGSVTVDGISLTVNSCGNCRFSLAVIPHTAGVTTLGLRKVGDHVNIEVDLIGKYIEKLLLAGRLEPAGKPGVDAEFLGRHGFL